MRASTRVSASPADESAPSLRITGKIRGNTCDAADAGTGAVSALALRRFEQRNRALADSLRYEIELAQGAVTDLELKRDVDLEKARARSDARLSPACDVVYTVGLYPLFASAGPEWNT